MFFTISQQVVPRSKVLLYGHDMNDKVRVPGMLLPAAAATTTTRSDAEATPRV